MDHAAVIVASPQKAPAPPPQRRSGKKPPIVSTDPNPEAATPPSNAALESPKAVLPRPSRQSSRPRPTQSRPNPLLAGSPSSVTPEPASNVPQQAPGDSQGERSPKARSSSGSRPNPLLMNSPKWESTPSPAGVVQSGSTPKTHRDGSVCEVQLELPVEAEATTEGNFAPAIFLEQLLSEEPSPRQQPTRKDKEPKTRKRSQNSRLRPPVCKGEQSERTSSAEGLLSSGVCSGTEQKANDEPVQPPSPSVAVPSTPSEQNSAGKPSKLRKGVDEGTGHGVQPNLPARRTARPSARTIAPQVQGRPASRGPRIVQASTADREPAPWDTPDSPASVNSPTSVAAGASAFESPKKLQAANTFESATKQQDADVSEAPTFGKCEADEKRVCFGSQKPSSGLSLGPAIDVQLERSPSLKDSIEFEVEAHKATSRGTFQEPLKQAFPLGEKLPLSALQQVPRPPLIVRLARLRDLSDVSSNRTATLSPMVALGLAIKPGPMMCGYKELCSQLRAQRAIGAHIADTKALLWWYMPYAFVAIVYLQVAAFVAFSEYALAVVPAVVMLVTMHHLRLTWCDRLLLAAVDNSAAADARAQLRPAMVWEGEAVFSAMLMAALREISAPQGLLLAWPRRQRPRRPLVCAAALLASLSIFRLIRLAAADEDSGYTMKVLEMALSVFGVCALVVFGCSPRLAQHRGVETDRRLAHLEAAINAMLDALRPLLAEPPREPPPSQVVDLTKQVPIGFGAFGAAVSQNPVDETFSVRLLTRQRLTLRATLQFQMSGHEHAASKFKMADASLCINCQLADFCIVASSLEGFTLTDLGRSAAGAVEVIENQPDTGATVVGNTLGFSMSGWAAAVVASTGRRGDDDAQTDVSGGTTSTASTLRSRGKGMKDEAALHLATGAVMALGHRRGAEPLQVFHTATYGAVVPPKTADDEPALLLTAAADNIRLHADVELEKDEYGVLRTQQELKKLCSASGGMRATSSAVSALPRIPCESSSQASVDSDEDKFERHPWSPSKAQSYIPLGASLQRSIPEPPKHIALLFDTYSERTRCVSLLRMARLLPEESGC